MIEFLGWGSFVLFLVMQVPQIIKTIKEKNVEGVSVWTWVIYSIALSMSAIYLYQFNEQKPWPIILNQAFSALLSLLQVVLFYKYKKGK